jgi:hypothetical protein
LYLDENISQIVADALQTRGIDALSTRDAERLGKDDESQLQLRP